MGRDKWIHGQHPADSVGQALRGTDKGYNVVLERLDTVVHYRPEEFRHAFLSLLSFPSSLKQITNANSKEVFAE